MTLPGTEPHPHARAVLGPALPPEGRPSHAYLFHGPAGTGKRDVARAFAAELLAEGSRDEVSARARVESGAHPDLTWVVPSGAHELLVDDVHEPVVAAATRTPFEARRRVFVIEAADTMNDQAANRMLKTLEEPADYVHLLLLTDRPSEVLPTIASRCQPVRFDPLGDEELTRRLEAEGADPAAARACARLALGDGGRARRLAFGDGPALRAAAEAFAAASLEGRAAERPWRALLEQMRARGDAAAAESEDRLAATLDFVAKRDRKRVETEYAERGRRLRRRAERGTLDLGLLLVGLWFRDLAAVAWGAGDLALNADRAEVLVAAAEGRDPASLRGAVELVEETRQRFALNVSEELACEALGYRLERLLGS